MKYFFVGLLAGIFLDKILPLKALLAGGALVGGLGMILLFLFHRGVQDFQGY